MAGRRRLGAFRQDAGPSARAAAPSRRQAVALVAVLVAVAGAIAFAAVAVKPSQARAFHLLYGSVFVDDNTAPVAVDLASGKPSVRLTNAYTQVGAKVSGDLDVVPLDDATLLLDTTTGEFNMLDQAGFVMKRDGGVSLPATSGTTGVSAVAAGSSAYVVRRGAASTSVYLVGPATVGAAADGGRVHPRASITMSTAAPAGAGTQVSANTTGAATATSDLWLLVGAGSDHTVRQLHVPPDSSAGASLTVHDHGTVTGPAALAVATVDGSQLVAVASSNGIEIFRGAERIGHVSVDPAGSVAAIRPVTNQSGRFDFLYRTASGWRLVDTATTATGAAHVSALDSITGTDLAVPAQSDGALYTMDRGSGRLWRIALSGSDADRARPLPGAATYPLVPGESPAYSQATVFARDTRVIVNSRANLEALTVFTDGSHAPVVVDKRTAVNVAPNGAEALAALLPTGPNAKATSTGARPPTQPSSQPPKPAAEQPVTDKIDCRTTTQIPHIPDVQLVSRGSRSVQLSWTYPLLDRQDCAPSTYTVSTQVVSGNAPNPPGTVKVDGVTGATITGLFPDTEYRFVVAAYLNGTHTPSAPLLVRTQTEGPAAPTDLHVTTDDQGDWLLSWNSCGGAAKGCVPVSSWTIMPQVCDSAHGLINPPATANLTGDPTAGSFSYVYRGGAGLLGSGLSFTVAGVSADGTTGAPNTDGDCEHSWAHPVPDDITVHASTPAHAPAGGTSSTTVTVTFTGDENVALGGAGGTLTYRLLAGDSLVTTVGPTSHTTVSLPGIKPGTKYRVQVVVTPPGHPEAAVTLDPVDVTAAVADWPAVTVSASYSTTTGLSLSFAGLSSANARGETFDLSGSQLVCGNTAMPLTATNYDPATPLVIGSVNRAVYNGSCVARVAFVEDAATIRSPAYFGGTVSPRVSSNAVTIPVPSLPTSVGDFAAAWAGGTSVIAVSYHGSSGSALSTYAKSWSVQALYHDATGAWIACGAPATQNLAQGPATLDVSSCYAANYQASWQVAVTFGYFGQSPPTPYLVGVSGSGPQPTDLDGINFTASWSGSSVLLAYTGTADPATFGGLRWSETVSSTVSGTCGSYSLTPGAQPLSLAVDLVACPPTSSPTTSPPTGTGTGSGSTTPPSGTGSGGGTTSPPAGPSAGSSAPSPDDDGATPLSGSSGTTPTTPPATGGGGSSSPPPGGTTASYTVTVTVTDPSFGTNRTYTVPVTGAPS